MNLTLVRELRGHVKALHAELLDLGAEPYVLCALLQTASQLSDLIGTLEALPPNEAPDHWAYARWLIADEFWRAQMRRRDEMRRKQVAAEAQAG